MKISKTQSTIKTSFKRTRFSRRKSVKQKMKRVRIQQFRSTRFLFPKYFTSPLTSFLAPNGSSEDFFRNFVRQFVLRTENAESEIPSKYCAHLHISSSLVWNLINDKPILPLLHGYYFTERQRYRGKLAEYFYLENDPSAVRVSARRSKILPFLIASPDFITSENNDGVESQSLLVEVKHRDRIKDLDRILKMKDDRINVQVLVTISVFESRAAKVVLILKRRNTRQPYRIYSEKYIEPEDDFIKKNEKLLIEKYFDNFLVPYFVKEFELIRNFFDHAGEKEWFYREVKRWQKHGDIILDHQKQKKRSYKQRHYTARCIRKYKSFFTLNS